MRYSPPSIDNFQDQLVRIHHDIFDDVHNIRNITFQVTEDCCLKCSYCYQTNKTHHNMKYEDILPYLQQLIYDKDEYINTSTVKGVVFDFIGGEPLMQIDLIQNICDYLYTKMIELDHPWLLYSRISICSNGVLYFKPNVQKFINKYHNFLSFSITIDGDKELHDSCRVDFDGNGSYDRAMSAVKDFYNRYGIMPDTKLTIAPANVNYLYKAIINLIDNGYINIHANCVFENGWTYDDAIIYYNQLKRLANYIIDNDLYNKVNISLFSELKYSPMSPDDNDNWCGGVDNKMFSIDYKGDYYPCIRYMDTSLDNKQKPLKIGSISTGYLSTDEEKENILKVTNITRRSQSTDECFYCPIAKGCAWCSGYNYQEFGTANKRATYICVMHKAEALANVYYWNSIFKKLNIDKIFINYLNDEEALKIISKQELDYLKNISQED